MLYDINIKSTRHCTTHNEPALLLINFSGFFVLQSILSTMHQWVYFSSAFCFSPVDKQSAGKVEAERKINIKVQSGATFNCDTDIANFSSCCCSSIGPGVSKTLQTELISNTRISTQIQTSFASKTLSYFHRNKKSFSLFLRDMA